MINKSSKSKLLFTVIMLAMAVILAGSNYSPAAAQDQIVSLETDASPGVGDTFDVSVNYDTSDDGKTTGIGLFIFFDSADVAYTGPVNVLQLDGALASQFTPEATDVLDDVAAGNLDGDDATDSYIKINWADLAGGFPAGDLTAGSVELATLGFTLTQLPTEINVTRDPQVSPPAYPGFVGNPLALSDQPVQHTIVASVTPSEGGSITPSGAVSVNNGADQTFTVSVNAGYTVQSVTVDGSSAQLTNNEYTFTGVTADHTIAVVFQSTQAVTHTITATATPSDGGSITPSGAVTVNEGGSQTFTVALNTGYEVQSFMVDGSAAQLDASNQYTFSNVTTDHTVAVVFAQTPAVTYNLTVDSAAGGTVSVSPSGPTYAENTVVTLTPNPNDCFIFSDWTGADAADVTANNQITMDSDKTIQPVFTANQSPDTPALVSPDGADPVDPFNETSFTVDGDIYSDPEGHAFNMTNWRISEDMAGTEVVYEASNEEFTFTVPGMTLDSNAEYYWSAQFVDAFGCASIWTSPAVMFNTNVATDAGGNGVPDAVESDLKQVPSSKIVFQTDDPDETRTIRVTAMGDTPAEVKLLAPKDIAAVNDDLQAMGVAETFYAAGFKTGSDQQGADVGNVSVGFDSWPSVSGHRTMLYIYNSTTGEFDGINPDDILSGSTIDLSGLLADGNDYDADMAMDGKISVPYLAVGIVEEGCAVSVTIFANDVTGSGGGTGDFSDTVPAVFDFSASVSGGPEEGYTYTWTIKKGDEILDTFTTPTVDNYTFDSTGEFRVMVEASKEGCPTLSDSKTVDIGEFHDDNCFIASSAAGVSGFFGLASLLAGLAAAVAWRKRR